MKLKTTLYAVCSFKKPELHMKVGERDVKFSELLSLEVWQGRLVNHIQKKPGALRLALSFALIILSFISTAGRAQSYDAIEGTVRRQIEDDRARTIGDCSEAMIS